MRAEAVPVLILPDAQRCSWLSIELSREKDGSSRLFKEFSSPLFRTNKEVLGQLDSFLAGIGAKRVRFEDNKSGSLRSILRRLNYSNINPYRLPKKIEVRSVDATVDQSPGVERFGVNGFSDFVPGDKIRRLAVMEKGALIGFLILTDYGRFARTKLNRYGSEGFGLIADGKDPSVVLTAVALQLLREGKRYMILGEEYSPYVDPVHPFPLWHMKLSRRKECDHGCRAASRSDVELLSRLTCEYEDTDIASATSTVLKNMESKEFTYILPPKGDGFALLKFMRGAEGMIHDLYVSPKDQGKGIGDELTRGSISMLSESCLSVHLNTIYPRAKRLYEKHGFSVEYMDYCIALSQAEMART